MRPTAKSRFAMAFAIAAVAFLVCAAISGTGWLPAVNDEDLTRIALLGAGLLSIAGSLLCVAFDRNRVEPAPPPAQHPKLHEWLFDLQAEIEKIDFANNQGAILSFIDLMTQPASFRSRVVETIDLDGSGTRQGVNIEFALPESAESNEVQYLPVLFPRKGQLLNGFKLADTGGTRITNLSYDETTRLVAVALRTLIAAVTNKTVADWSTRTHQAELILLGIITSRGPIEDGNHLGQVNEALKRVEGPLTQEAKDLIRGYVMLLSASYPVVAVVSPGAVVANRALIAYERAITPAAAVGHAMGSIRLGLKLKPREVVVPLSLSLTAASYHLRINAPSEKYLYGQHIRCHACKQRLAHNWRGADPAEPEASKSCFHKADPGSTEDCHYHAERRRGQNFLHLYMRGYGTLQKPIRNLEVMAVFKEMPPGTRGAATITALATTVFIWVAGYLISHSEIIGNSDIPALMLALPAIGASYFGFTADSGTLVGSSLLARISFTLSGLLSVIAIVLYIIHAADASQNSTATAPHLAFAGLAGPVWVPLFSLSAANSIYTGWRFIRKLRYYAMLTNRPDVIDEGFRWH